MDLIALLLQDLWYGFLFVAFYGGIVTLLCLGVYCLVRLLSKPLAGGLSYYLMIRLNRSVLRLLSPSSSASKKSFLFTEIKNEGRLTLLLKSIAIKNGWKAEDIEKMPVWLLTGNIVTDANPNLPFQN